MKIIVEVKSVYGQERIYPVCEKAKLFCSIQRTKTLGANTIKIIKALGFTVEVQTPSI